MLNIIKKPEFIAAALLIIALPVGAYFYFNQSKTPAYNFIAAEKTDFKSEIKATGAVKSAEDIKLAFLTPGRVAGVNVKVNDQVRSGQVLASLVNNDLAAGVAQASSLVQSAQAQLQNYQAAYELQRAKLDEIKRGARPEDLDVSQTAVINAENSLNDAKANLDNVKVKTQTDLNNLYAKTNDIINTAYAQSLDAINTKTIDVFTNGTQSNPFLTLVTPYPDQETRAINGRTTANRNLTDMNNIASSPTTDQNQLDANLAKVKGYLDQEKLFLEELSVLIDNAINLSATAKASSKSNANLGLTSVNTVLASINSQNQAVTALKAGNTTAITTAQNQVNQAQYALDAANRQLELKKAGSTKDQVKIQEQAVNQAQAAIEAQYAQIRQAQAGVANAAAQYQKSLIVSPIDGVVTERNVDPGEIASMNAPAITVMSKAKFQIEIQIPEADIAKAKVGQTAKVTLDAYGNTKTFDARVITIDPAATMAVGTPVYKTTLEFLKEDPLIKSGLTANVEITASEKKGVLSIPELSIIKKGGENYVIVDNGTPSGEERKIVIGESSGDGQVEVVSGLAEGERVADFGSSK